MYVAHFKLREPPFLIAPDPAFLYLSPRHQEALGHLLYGTGQHGGFVQLTGEVGTGKTTIVRTLLAQQLNQVEVAMIHNPRQNELEFVASICDELNVVYEKPAVSIKTLVDALNQHLLQAHASGRRTVLIVDEAQNLDPSVLEQVRLLTNLETDKEKLLRIMLVGQPELIELLARPELRQLASRITARYHLTPLSQAETIQYIGHRLQVAGGANDLFTDAAMRRVHRYAKGIPRQINILCDRSLLGAYAKSYRSVTPEIVDRAAAETLGGFGQDSRGKRLQQWAEQLRHGISLRWIESALALAALVVAAVVLSDRLAGHRRDNPPAAPSRPAEAAAVPPAAATAGTAPIPAEAGIGALRASAQPLPVVMSRLIGLWDPKIVIARGENVCEALSQQNLECYKSSGQWSDLAQLNRPAILRLNMAPGSTVGDTQYVLLQSLNSDAAVLDTGNGPLRLPLSQLENVWSGEFLLLWRRDTEAASIDPGAKGASVVWLRRRLAEAKGVSLSGPVPVNYGPELRSELADFQTAHGLAADGIAGTRTLILLSDIGRPVGTPVLEEASE